MTNPSLGQVRVRQLEWTWNDRPYFTWAAESLVGPYRAWEISGTACVLRPYDRAGVIVGATADDAKAAAQADYEARILASLDLSPTVVEEEAIPCAACGGTGGNEYGPCSNCGGSGAILLAPAPASPSKPEEGADHIADAGKMVPVPEPQAVAWMIPDWGAVYGKAGYRYLTDSQARTPRDEWEDGEYDAFQAAMKAAVPLYAAPLSGGGRVEVTEALTAEEVQILDRLKRDNTHDGVRSVIESDFAPWFSLSERGLIAMEQHARGIIPHITRLGVRSLTAALATMGGTR